MKHKKNEYEIMWADYCKVINDVCPNAGNCEECRKEYEDADKDSNR